MNSLDKHQRIFDRLVKDDPRSVRLLLPRVSKISTPKTQRTI